MAALDVISKVLQKVFGSRNERLIKRYSRVAEQIEALEPELCGDFEKRFAERASSIIWCSCALHRMKLRIGA